MSADRIDHYTEARGRIATQYVESYKFLSSIRSFTDKMQEIEDALLAVRDLMDIDIATGVNLDVIGDIVGVSRVIKDALPLSFFGFSDTPAGLRFGEEGAVGLGARFYNEGETYTASTTLADPEYRLAIRAKIVRNHSVGTGDDILRGMQYIFQGAYNVIEDVGGMRIKLGVGRPLTDVEQLLIKNLDLLPRPAGVRITVVVFFNADNYFGFADQPNARGFAEEGSLDGGFFAEEF